ncbi:MAG: hypothetical protein KME26_25670 [Oscillatoria princeps RMCB-10]|jgi:hypothetical protein|nr:hypothetical protein [Oscillatoria princeps RMCB-10]
MPGGENGFPDIELPATTRADAAQPLSWVAISCKGLSCSDSTGTTQQPPAAGGTVPLGHPPFLGRISMFSGRLLSLFYLAQGESPICRWLKCRKFVNLPQNDKSGITVFSDNLAFGFLCNPRLTQVEILVALNCLCASEFFFSLVGRTLRDLRVGFTGSREVGASIHRDAGGLTSVNFG